MNKRSPRSTRFVAGIKRYLFLTLLTAFYIIAITTIEAKPASQAAGPTLILAFVPLNWTGTLDEFDRAVEERVALFVVASGIENYAQVEVEIIHEIFWGDLNDDQLHTQMVAFGLEQTPADLYIGLTDGDLLPETAVAGWANFAGNGLVAEVEFASIVAHELGHIFGLCDEYNYAVWQRQDTALESEGGCPNPYPDHCERCDQDEGACCSGWPTEEDGVCLMGPADPRAAQYGPECFGPLQQAFAERFPPPAPTATPAPLPTSQPSRPTPAVSPTPPTAPFDFSALVEIDNQLRLGQAAFPTPLTDAPIPIEGNIYAFAWRPGGERLVVSAGRENNLDLYLWETAAGRLTRLTQTPHNEAQPAWRPGSDHIIFVSDQDDNADLYQLDLSANTVTRLTGSPGREQHPAVSPDGRFVSYSYQMDGSSTLALLDLTTGETTQPDLGLEALHPAWSLDGQKVAFAALFDESWDIAVWSRQTGRTERLTYGGGPHLAPAWLPEDRLLFQTRQDGRWTVYLMQADGTNWRRLTGVEGNVRAPAYIP